MPNCQSVSAEPIIFHPPPLNPNWSSVVPAVRAPISDLKEAFHMTGFVLKQDQSPQQLLCLSTLAGLSVRDYHQCLLEHQDYCPLHSWLDTRGQEWNAYCAHLESDNQTDGLNWTLGSMHSFEVHMNFIQRDHFWSNRVNSPQNSDLWCSLQMALFYNWKSKDEQSPGHSSGRHMLAQRSPQRMDDITSGVSSDDSDHSLHDLYEKSKLMKWAASSK